MAGTVVPLWGRVAVLVSKLHLVHQNYRWMDELVVKTQNRETKFAELRIAHAMDACGYGSLDITRFL